MRHGRRIASVLVWVFRGWQYLTGVALVLGVALAVSGWRVAVQIGADGLPNIVAGDNVLMAIPVEFQVDSSVARVSAAAIGVDRAEIGQARGVLQFPPPENAAFGLAALAMVIGLCGILVWILGQLAAICTTLRDGTPFVAVNARRIRRIAFLIVAGELARAGLVYAANYYAQSHFVADGFVFSARLHLNAFTVIETLILLALAEVFRLGTRLDEEHALTV